MLDSATNGNRRFYLTDSTAGVVELAKGISNSFSPCVVMESSVEGGGKITRPMRNYPIYCLQPHPYNGPVGFQQFLTWLKSRHDSEIAENINGDFARISMDDYIDITTVGPIENGWFAVLIQFEREEPLNLCISEDLYIDEIEN